MPAARQPATGLLLSGGLDSAVLLDQLLAKGGAVVPLYVRSGFAWQEAELAAVRRYLEAVAQSGLEPLVLLHMPLQDLYGRHWSITARDVPDDSSPDEAVFLPGRNPLLLIKPALWCQQHGISRLVMATLANNPFADATPEFFSRFETMLTAATGAHVEIARPFERLLKTRVMDLGRHLPLHLTFSCLAPVGSLHCGRCNKCGERRAAFKNAGIVDATVYAGAGAQPTPSAAPPAKAQKKAVRAAD